MLEQLTELAAAASKRRAADGTGRKGGAGAGAGMRVRDVLELSVFAFARLGLSGQAEALADADSPHMTIFQSVLSVLLSPHLACVCVCACTCAPPAPPAPAPPPPPTPPKGGAAGAWDCVRADGPSVGKQALTRLLLVHTGGAGNKEMSNTCNGEASEVCVRLIRVARRHGRAAGELSEVLGCASDEGRAFLPAVLQGMVEHRRGLQEFYSHDGGDTAAASSSMGKAFALGSSLLGGGGGGGAGKKKLGEGVGVVVVLVMGAVCLHHAHAVNMLGDLPSGAKILLVPCPSCLPVPVPRLPRRFDDPWH